VFRLGRDPGCRAAESGLVSIQPIEADDDLVNDLIERNAAFRALLVKSLASPRESFPFVGSE